MDQAAIGKARESGVRPRPTKQSPVANSSLFQALVTSGLAPQVEVGAEVEGKSRSERN